MCLWFSRRIFRTVGVYVRNVCARAYVCVRACRKNSVERGYSRTSRPRKESRSTWGVSSTQTMLTSVLILHYGLRHFNVGVRGGTDVPASESKDFCFSRKNGVTTRVDRVTMPRVRDPPYTKEKRWEKFPDLNGLKSSTAQESLPIT